MNVADAMTPRSEVVTVTIPGTRDDALEYLQEQAFSSVPVIKETDDGEEFRGIISRDALIESPDEDQLALLVEEVPAISGDTSIEAAAQVMVEDGERRLPIVDGQLKGIITVTDVIRSIANGDVDGDKVVDELANRDINCVYEGTPLTVAERELSHANVPYGVVLGDDGDMSGMLTEVDIIAVARVVEGEDDTGDSIANQDDDWAWEGIKAVGGRYMPTRNVELPAEPVREFMTSDVVTVNKRRTAEEAAQLMIEHDIEQIPLLSGDELTGIVRDIDLLRGL
ncbi:MULTISPECIES: CBS domain-containing protein [Haloarcula]|uniref:CBS domain-containing protein n=3 Tax=Haloarcula TaxID=2237 RepID=A0A830FM00_HALAR|nr:MULTISPECIES: CBS domain-containing protein [Haloarcula]EMA20810.1 inosine monophosphate dehydrogenase [Haloarcula argentinensis DSM 12282]MDS0254990.1 CBS domain-containing protein [Haloarcula argentinensis]GGK58758.1 CBS domain-containing protein [Haloarcula sebkhae]GGM37502.1 CBS domain-containing protein [Haloarcula argentinensis]